MGRYRGLKITAAVLAGVIVFFTVINIIPPAKVMENNPFIVEEGELPMIAAHRGGSKLNPENTLKAFDTAVHTLKTEIIESDLWLTKDGHLVFNHDSTINRMSDAVLINEGFEYSSESKGNDYKIEDYTMAELQQYNMGYMFTDKEGNRPYKDLLEGVAESDRANVLKANKLQILEFEDMLEYFYDTDPDLLFIVEIKNGGEKGYKAADIIDDVLTNKYPEYKNRLVVGTFKTEVENYLKESHPTIIRGGSTGGVTSFVITQMLKVNLFCDSDFQCLQIPMSSSGFDLTWDTYIDRAHRKNMAVQYWTINDREDMIFLINKGVDCIMTDDPELLIEVYAEMKN